MATESRLEAALNGRRISSTLQSVDHENSRRVCSVRLNLTSATAILMLLTLACWAAANTLVVFKTPVGDMEFELFDADKPITVRNFFRYVESNRYENLFIERWAAGFVIQAGGQVVSNRYTVPQVVPVPSFGDITNEYGVGRTYSNVYGTLAMARRGGATNSASSSWFVNLGDNSFLDSVDGGFTVFGRLLRGTNVLDKFVSEAAAGAAGMSWLEPNPFFPVDALPLSTTNVPPTYADLVYVDIRILATQIELLTNGTASIAWNSVSNRQHIVEWVPDAAATNWTVLVQTNGTGNTMQAVDPGAGVTTRVYRVRVAY